MKFWAIGSTPKVEEIYEHDDYQIITWYGPRYEAMIIAVKGIEVKK